MTATTARLLPVGPGKVRNAVMNALGRHGVSASTAESIWLDLTTGQDPRPADVPEYMHFRGIRLTWPRGRHTRPLIKAEIDVLNAALHAAGEHRADRMADLEDTAEVGRGVYAFLLARKQGKHVDTLGLAYNPEPVRAEEMRLLVEEATEVRREANKPRTVCGDCGRECEIEHDCDGGEWLAEHVTVEPETDACPFSHSECLTMQEQGEGACDEHEPPTREERIAAMPKIEMVAKPEPIKPEPVAQPEPDALTALLADIEALHKALGL